MEEEAVRRAIADHLGVSPSLIHSGTRLSELDADARDLVALAVRLEKTFRLHISDEAPELWATIEDVMRSIRSADAGASYRRADSFM